MLPYDSVKYNFSYTCITYNLSLVIFIEKLK